MASAARKAMQRSLASCSRAAARSCDKSRSKSSCCASRLQICSESNVGATAAPRVPTESSSCPFAASRSLPSSPIGVRRFASHITRLPGEIGVLQSLIPLYSAAANSRLVSGFGTSGSAPILQEAEELPFLKTAPFRQKSDPNVLAPLI